MQQMIHDMHHAGVTEGTLHTMYDDVPAIGLKLPVGRLGPVS